MRDTPVLPRLGWHVGTSISVEFALRVFTVAEETQGTDLNGDGDAVDLVVHFLDTQREAAECPDQRHGSRAAARGWPARSERRWRYTDRVVHFAEMRSTAHLDRDAELVRSLFPLAVEYGSLLSSISAEDEQDRDLNEDGDVVDLVLQISDASRGTTRNSGLETLLIFRAILANPLPPRTAALFPFPLIVRGDGHVSLAVVERSTI